jgi:hypothetical protein
VTERGDQVQKLLATLSRHSDLVAEAFDGTVSGGDKQRNSAIEALFGLGILKPYDEDSYRLNPRLREFFADHFASYHAFQALRRVSSTMQQAQEQWRELRRLRISGSAKDQATLYAALDESIVEMGYSIEHNLAMLHALLSTQYGNVDDLSSKLRQNRYYARQVEQFLRDVHAIDDFSARAADEAIAAGMSDIRQLVVRRLGAKCLTWTSQIKDAQEVISKRLFEAKLMEMRVKRLSRFSLWLTRHRTADGWDLPVDAAAVAMDLLRPEPIGLRPQPDVGDMDPAVRDNLLVAVAKLPLRPSKAVAVEESQPQYLVLEDDEPVIETLTPAQQALHDLKEASRRSTDTISLLEWKRARPQLEDVPDGVWLMYASLQLKGNGLVLAFAREGVEDPFEVNTSFYDIDVSRTIFLEA